MQLDVELNMTLNGTAEEKYKMLLILKKYSDPNSDTDAHFDDMKFLSDNQIVRIDDLTDEDLRKYAKNQNGIKICAVGLNEDYSYEWGKIQIFHLMAEVVPDAVFEGRLDVETSYHKQSQTYCLANRKLEINTVFYSYESEFDDYTNYISKRLTWSKFKKWFQIDSDDLEKEDYLEFVSTYHYAFGETELAYEEWMEFFDEYDWQSSLEEDDYDEVKEKIEALNLRTFKNFQNGDEFGVRKHFVYDPITKKYLNE